MSITEKRLNEIQKRLDAATDGPWAAQPDRTGTSLIVVSQYDTLWDAVGMLNDPDARMIAHAPDDLADLLAEVERLRALTTVDDDMV